jgi:hypothetical protein
MNPQLPKILQVSYNTTKKWVWYVPVPTTGTVYVSMGAVLEKPTCGLPVLNPKKFMP